MSLLVEKCLTCGKAATIHRSGKCRDCRASACATPGCKGIYSGLASCSSVRAKYCNKCASRKLYKRSYAMGDG